MICIDPLVKYASSTPYRYHGSWYACHMFASDDDLESLHHMAQLIGLRREWFQEKRYPPHYDLIGKAKRQLALACGAQEVSRQYAVLMDRRRRNEVIASERK